MSFYIGVYVCHLEQPLSFRKCHSDGYVGPGIFSYLCAVQACYWHAQRALEARDCVLFWEDLKTSFP